MKARLFCTLVVLGLVTVSFAQKPPHDLGILILTDATSVVLGEPVHIELFVTNNGARSVTIREIELYVGCRDHDAGTELLSAHRVTIEGSDMVSFDWDYTPSCTGNWSAECFLRFGGSGKGDLMGAPRPFTVIE